MMLASLGMPTVISNLLPKNVNAAVMQPRNQTSIYSHVNCNVSPCAPMRPNKGFANNAPNTPRSTDDNATMSSPELVKRCASKRFWRPNACANVVITPVPKPKNTPLISMTTGNVNPMAANGFSSCSCPTKNVSAML